jgi:hypothetical protein
VKLKEFKNFDFEVVDSMVWKKLAGSLIKAIKLILKIYPKQSMNQSAPIHDKSDLDRSRDHFHLLFFKVFISEKKNCTLP